ncbi:hypothetical protein C8Q74DRAFT_1201049 [Fomes fomentarius]|nr:hypothetical protein C8Q74DRAFT_1201049 [Fomes fomentarius]
MAPSTRSSARHNDSSHADDPGLQRDEVVEEPGPHSTLQVSPGDCMPALRELSHPSSDQDLLKRATRGAKSLEQETEALRKKVKALETKLEKVQQADDTTVQPRRSRRAAASVSNLQGEVHLLQDRVRKLEKSKDKYRRKLHEMTMREAKTDVDELMDDAEFEVGDSAYKMRTLLRDFGDLMASNALGDSGEDCPICFEKLEPKHCKSFPCQHMVCETCAAKLKPEAEAEGYADEVDSVSCPECRTVAPRDELEVVERTATERWDALLAVATRWAKIDVRREEDTSEEEAEEEFIDDGENEER